jgi:hypothetical protein
MRSLVLSFTLAVALLVPRLAHPCSCARDGVTVHPNARETAPLNTQIRVMWPKHAISLAPASLRLQTADKSPKIVATSQIVLSAADTMIVVLIPDAPLAAKTRYQLVGAESTNGKPALLGNFSTGGETDTSPPSWKGPGKASLEVSNPLLCGTGKTAATILLPDAAALHKEGVLIGVWSLPPGPEQPFDPAAPPVILAPLWGDGIRLGAPSICSAANFDLPVLAAPGDPPPATPVEVKVRIAPIDLAGNVGKPAEVVMRRGATARPRKGKLPPLPRP